MLFNFIRVIGWVICGNDHVIFMSGDISISIIFFSHLLRHKSWSDLYGLKPRSLRKPTKNLWNELYAAFKPYNARFITTSAPNIAPNSSPHVDQIFFQACCCAKYITNVPRH